ncbi:MAG: ribonuclease H-like domain-containing protein [Verrucomicrobiales bacterium]
MSSTNILYFDLETQRSANDVGGWNHKSKMGMSVAVTFSTRTGHYRIYDESNAFELADELRTADLVVGFNHLHFDLHVLQPYTMWDLAHHTINLDLMIELEQKLGHRLKLEALALATLGFGKTADGLEAIRWWREGRVMDIAKYCAYDVKVTRLVHEFGREKGHVKYVDRFGRPQAVEVKW